MFTVLLRGQLISILLTLCSTTSQFLGPYKIPTFQLFITYLVLCIYVIYYKSIPRHWTYSLIAFFDVMANYCLIKAYQYTDLLSISLLNRLSIPIVMILSKYFLKTRYTSRNYIGMLICVSGSLLVVYSDYQKKSGTGSWIGDVLCVVGACLYALANTLQEYLVKESTIPNYLTSIGGYGVVFAGILLGIEYKEMAHFKIDQIGVIYMLVFVTSMFFLYSCVPRFIMNSSATLFNLSILTSDIYNLLVSVFIFGIELTWLYAVAFAIILIGIYLFHSSGKDSEVNIV
eukprot:NODE_71_length_24927_cov_1.205937.p12 type:complete len:287 gc:universal NODE_71_length_24927_cov_1.205937:5011-5871(+)